MINLFTDYFAIENTRFSRMSNKNRIYFFALNDYKILTKAYLNKKTVNFEVICLYTVLKQF